jgi:23S rRNA (uracil1939-C5)-methyltransferase
VRIRLTDEKRGFARGELVKVLSSSPERVAPRCRHFGACGGCHYQHLPYARQLLAKTEILRDQLVRIGRIVDPPVAPMVACPDPWNYRNHIQFHLDEAGRIGFQAPYSNRLVPISECHLPEALLNAVWPQLHFEAGSEIERISLRLGAEGEVMLVLESLIPEPPALEIQAAISVVHSFEDHTVVLAGADCLRMRVLERDFLVSAGSFFQVNTLMAGKMVAHVLERLPAGLETILDVYCGAGLFSAFLAPKCGRLIAVESSPSACADFTVNLDEFGHVELYEGSAEEVLPHLQASPDFALADPPRAGLDRRALDAILKLGPPTLVYISCDPSTLARDAARLIAGGYRLVEVTPFDLFPQTYHIESLSFFAR